MLKGREIRKGSEKERETGSGHLQDHVHLEAETRRENEIVTEIWTVTDNNAFITAGMYMVFILQTY
jgi:hypothetical protein